MTSFGVAIDSATGAATAPRSGAGTRLARAAAAVETDLVRDAAALAALVPEWSALEGDAPGAILFQSAAWARAIFDFEGARGNKDFDPVIVTLRQLGVLVAVLPLERVRSRFRTVLTPLGKNFGQYADLVVARDVEARAALARMLRAAIDGAPCDAVALLKVRDDSALRAAMPANHLLTGTVEAAPSVALSNFADFAAYHQTIKPKTRKNMRNARNRLEREGVLEHIAAANAEDVRGVIARTLEGRAGRLKQQGLTSRAFRDGAFADFCTALSAGKADGPELLAMSLRHNGEPIAEQWGFVHRGRYYAYVASRDFSVGEESPGKLHLREVIETCFARGLATADFLVPAMPYKLTWATDVTPVHDYALPVTPMGLVSIHFYDRFARPLLKKIVLGLPRGLRLTLMKLAGLG